MRKTVTLLLWIIAFQLIAYGISMLTQQHIPDWYNGLNKSSLTPSNWVFPTVWSILYVLLAVVGWMLWNVRQEAKPAFIWYCIQMVFNWLWTPIFFGLEQTSLALGCIVIIIIATIFSICYAWRPVKVAAVLLIPYLCWIIFASYLNTLIVMLN